MTIGPRQKQEDCILMGADLHQAGKIEKERDMDSDPLLLAVCDGMGGHEDGDAASRFACEQLKSMPIDRITDAEALNDAIGQIQDSAEKELSPNSGTTIAGLIARKDKILVFNAGDSRVYKVTPTELVYISHDHSLVQELVDKSLIHRDIAGRHPLKNLIEFGIGPIFSPVWGQECRVHIREEAVADGLVYLLCTDGVMDAMSDPEIHARLMPSPVDQGPHLFAALKTKGLNDNASFIIAEMRQ